MKKRLITLFVAVVATVGTAMAGLIGESSVGGEFLYGGKGSRVGLGAKYQFEMPNNIRIEPGIRYFFKKNGTHSFGLGVNVHYVFHNLLVSRFNAYPILGLGYNRWTFSYKDVSGTKWSHTDGRIGVNFGAGAEYGFTKRVYGVLELRSELNKDYSQFVLSLGAKYKF